MNLVANAIYYNPALALQALSQQGHLEKFLFTWFQVINLLPCFYSWISSESQLSQVTSKCRLANKHHSKFLPWS